MFEQIVPSAIAKRVIMFPTNENVKAIEILLRLCVQFGEETLLKAQVYKWYNNFRGRRKEVQNFVKFWKLSLVHLRL